MDTDNMLFTCERCDFTTAYKCSLVTHLKAKNPCPELKSKISREEHIEKLRSKEVNGKSCRFCGKRFVAYQNRHKHEKICGEKASNSSELEDLKQKVDFLQQKLDQVLDVGHTSLNINNGTINNNNINIIINNYGDENKSYLSKDFLTKCLRKKHQGMLDLIKALHFHSDHNENHNIRISNKKLPYIEKYIETRWQYFDKKEVIDDLIKEGWQILDEHQYDNEEELKSMMSKRLFDDIDNWLNTIQDREKKTMEPLRRDIYLVILNNSYMVLTK
jgi:hypothetical protein